MLSGTYAHDEKALSALCRTLMRLEVVLVAIERPDGVLVERLVDAGLRVLALHPNKVAPARDRFRVSGGKSDRFDAFVLCELARTDNHRFRVLEPDSDQTKALRALTRAREELVGSRTGVVNQLRAELELFWPGPLRLFSHMDAEILLAFLERYPSPADARGLGVARMQAFWNERATRAGSIDCVDGQAPQRPRGRVGELELTARRQLVLTFVAMIRTLNAQIKQLEREIRIQVRAHPDGRIFLSLFKSPVSVITAAELLAEIGDCRERYPTRDALTADAAHAAVAKESGKPKTVGFRWAATNDCASRSAGWPTAVATGTPGPRASTPRPVSAATSIYARSAHSDAPGAAWYGSAGATTHPMTPRGIARYSATSPSPSPPGQARRSTRTPSCDSPNPVCGDRISPPRRRSPDHRISPLERKDVDTGRLRQRVTGQLVTDRAPDTTPLLPASLVRLDLHPACATGKSLSGVASLHRVDMHLAP